MQEPQIIHVPLSRLNPIANGVRKTNGVSIAELVASIRAEGLLQNLTIARDTSAAFAGAGEFEHYQVIAGSRRLRALRQLAEQNVLPSDYQVPCRLIEESQALTASLAENAIREQMHQADEFMAFRDMVDKKHSIEDIAARFGVTPLVVQRRLKLANVSPRLFELFREDKITLAQMMSLALTDDHKQQEKVWFKAEHEWMRSPEKIREALTKKEIDSTRDPLALFVGLREYERAGGTVHRDLFSDKGAGFITDVTLLKTLAAKKLEDAAVHVREEGWSFVEVRPKVDQYTDLKAFQRNQPSGQRKPTDVERKRTQALMAERAEIDKKTKAIEEQEHPTAEEDAEYDAMSDRMGAIATEIEDMQSSLSKWDPKVLSQAGAIVTIDNGHLRIYRGLSKNKIRVAKDAKAKKQTEQREKAIQQGLGHTDALMIQLSASVSFALTAELIANPGMAIIALTHRLLLDAFYDGGRYNSVITLNNEQQQRPKVDDIPDPATNPDVAKMHAEMKAIQKLLPNNDEQLLAWLQTKDAPITRLLAYCIAVSVDAVIFNESHLENWSASPLASALKLDMRTRWTPRPDNYLSRVSADQIRGAMKEAGADKNTLELAKGMKKLELVAAAQPVLANWVPKPLRFAAGK